MGHFGNTSKLAIGCCAIMVIAFFAVLFQESLNTPSFDDYAATVAFIKDFFFRSSTATEKFEMLLKRHNEHFILPSRLLAAGYFALFNRINFAHLVYIQNIFLVGSMFLVYRLMIRQHFPWQHSMLVCSSFMLSLNFYQVSFFYWGGIQYYTVVFFSLLSLWYLDKARRVDTRFVSSMLFAVMAMCSFGNGILTLLLGCILLWAKKQRSMLIVWLGLTLMCAMAFLLSMPDKSETQASSFRVDWMARLLLTFLGSFLYFRPFGSIAIYVNILLCIGIGAFVIGYWIWLFKSGYARARPLLFCFFSFPMLTALMIAFARFETKSAGGIAPRYMFFSAIIPIMTLLTLWDKGLLNRHWLTRVSIGCVLIWSVSFFPNYIEFHHMNSDIEARVARWESDSSTRLIYYSDPFFSSSVRRWAVERHIIESSPKKRD